MSAGDYLAAQATLRWALELNRRDHKPRGVVTSLFLLGDAHLYAGEAEVARRYYREAAALVRHEGLGWGNDDFALDHLGKAALALGDFGEVENVAYELLERHPSPDTFRGGALELLGRIATAQGHYEQATDYLGQVAQMCLEHPDDLNLGQLGNFQDIILSFTELWVKEKRYVQAAAVLTFLLRHLYEAYARAWTERLLADVRSALSAEELGAAARRSHELSLEVVVKGFLAGD